LVELRVVNCHKAGVEKHLAVTPSASLTRHQAPFLDALPALARCWLAVILDELVDCRENILWHVRRALLAQEIDEGVRNGH
jgi:hypothetical protein